MIVCPLCEHAQPGGDECEICGKRLAAASSRPDVPPIEGLEPTHLAARAAVLVERLEGLEATRVEGVAAASHALPDLEPTRAEPASTTVEKVPGLEPTLADPGPVTVAERGQVTCRACRTPAAAGEAMCARCGMRLPTVRASAGAGGEPEAGRCCGCGARVPGPVCPGCGGRVRALGAG